jgi:hypothetical protein
LYRLDDEWILGPPGALGDQLVVKSFVTATLQAVPGSVGSTCMAGSPLTTDIRLVTWTRLGSQNE